MNPELFRMGVNYVHLIAACVAVGMVFMSDLRLTKDLLDCVYDSHDEDDMHSLQRTILRSLVILWVTGAALCAIDVWMKGWAIFENPKLQAKIAVVVLLSLNGWILHRFIMPLVAEASSVLHLPFSARHAAIFFGAVSGVSWLYAAALGIGRPLNWKYSLWEILIAYPIIIALGFAMMSGLMAWCKRNKGA